MERRKWKGEEGIDERSEVGVDGLKFVDEKKGEKGYVFFELCSYAKLLSLEEGSGGKERGDCFYDA